MRRIFALFAAVCMLMSIPPAAADFTSTLIPIPGYTLRPSTADVLVFTNKSIKANIAGYIKADGDQTVQVLDISDDWCYISFSSGTGVSYGYLPLSCFDYTPAPTAPPTQDSPTVFVGGSQGWILNDQEGSRLNLRSEPAVTAPSLGKYFTGTPIIFTGNQQNGYVQVLLAGTAFGWVDGHYVTIDAASLVPETPLVTINNPGSGAVLRAGPSTSYNRIGWYGHGTAITVLGVQDNDWHHVQIGDTTGYISPSLLSGIYPFDTGIDSDHPTDADTQQEQQPAFFINTRTAGGQLNLRKSASTDAKSIGLFYTGTPVLVLNYTRSGWAYVRIGQTEGYMDASYLSSAKPTQYGAHSTVQNTRATGLNLRNLPSTGGELLDFAPNYAAVTILGELSDGWCYVDYQGTLGYMLGTSLKK